MYYLIIFVLLKIVCANAFLIKDWNKRILACNLVIKRKFNYEVSYFRIRRWLIASCNKDFLVQRPISNQTVTLHHSHKLISNELYILVN